MGNRVVAVTGDFIIGCVCQNQFMLFPARDKKPLAHIKNKKLTALLLADFLLVRLYIVVLKTFLEPVVFVGHDDLVL